MVKTFGKLIFDNNNFTYTPFTKPVHDHPSERLMILGGNQYEGYLWFQRAGKVYHFSETTLTAFLEFETINLVGNVIGRAGRDYNNADEPSNLNAIPGDTETTITFTKPRSVGSEITNYEYSFDDDIYTAFSPATGDVSSVTITGLSNDQSYLIKLRGVNAEGSGVSSATVSVTPIAP